MNENLPIIVDDVPHLRQKKKNRKRKRLIIALLAAATVLSAAAVLAATGTFAKLFNGKSSSVTDAAAQEQPAPDIYSFDRKVVPDGVRAVVPADISGGGESITPVPFSLNGKVVVIASHPYEAYLDGAKPYVDGDFSAVGEENTTADLAKYLATALSRLGVDAEYLPIDTSSALGSYAKASDVINAYKKDHDVACVIDVHRAVLKGDNGDLIRPITNKGGEAAAQTVLVVASGVENTETRAGNAAALAEIMNSVCERSASVSFADGKLGQDACDVFITADIGSAGNSYAEAVRGASVVASALAEMAK